MPEPEAELSPEPPLTLEFPDMPGGLLRARTDCDYWDDTSQLGDSHGSHIGNLLSCGQLGKQEASSSTSNLLLESAASSFAKSSQDLAVGVVRGSNFSWVRGELIGQGTLGTVWKVLNRRTGQLMAAKEVLLDAKDKADEKFRAALQNEIDLYKDLKHPHIVSYFGNDFVNGKLYIYLEYMPGGSIAQVLSQFGPLDESLSARYMRNLLEGLEYLHTRDPPVLHRDIKGANILVGLDRVVKLSDFGCSKRSEGTMVQTLRGSVPWMAPEVMRQSEYGRKADVWSIGCVLIEMSTAAAPWGHFDNCLAAMIRIAMSDETPPVPDHLSESCRDLVARCTRRAPEERPSASELLRHGFVAGVLDPSAIDESWEA